MIIKDVLKKSVSCKYLEYTDNLISFICEKQLKDMALWEMLARQFCEHSDAADYGWRGEFWGKLMRGACGVYEYTRDKQLYDVLAKSVCILLKNTDGKGRLFTYDDETEFHGWDIWSRKYVLLGLLHFYDICTDTALRADVLETMRKHLDYIMEHIGSNKTEIYDTSQVWQGINSASILEPVVRLYSITEDKRYLDFAEYIVNSGGASGCNIFELAFADEIYPYEYPVRKAYELMSCFEGLLEYHKATGISKWRKAVVNFAKRVAESEITIIGGAGCEHECFNNSALMQTYTKYNGLMQETCVTVTWMKLCFRLLKLTGESVWADYIEQSAYNALFGSVNTDESICPASASFDLEYFKDVYAAYTKNNGGQLFDSYSPLRKGIRGRAIGGFRDMDNKSAYCGCCIAIGAAGLAIIPAAAVMRREDGYVFSMYMNGEVSFEDAVFGIETEYPAKSYVEISVIKSRAEAFCIRLRIPRFSKNTLVYVNGDKIDTAVCGTYLVIKSKWKPGDKIRLEFDMAPRILRGRHNPDDIYSEKHMAFMYGPLVLATDKRLPAARAEKKSVDGLVLTPLETDIRHICAFNVQTENMSINMIDYASAGKTWDERSECAAWILKEAIQYEL